MTEGSCNNVIVLLGPSGSGKTTYGQRFKGPYSNFSSTSFLSTGDRLLEEGYISIYREPNMRQIKRFCYELISKAFIDFKTSESCMLVLDCVKDLEDAEFVAAEASKYDFKITKALLFEASEELLEQSWRQRAKDIDMFHLLLGSARDHLFEWRKKSNDVINYYRYLNILSKMPCQPRGQPSLHSLRILTSNQIDVPPTNNLQFMLLESKEIRNVLMAFFSILQTTKFQFSLPASFVHSFRDLRWIANPTRYYVTIKADGVRCLLLKLSDGAYLITRKNEIYPCNIANDQLPENTVLDGELLPSSAISDIHPKSSMSEFKTSVFLAFDVLAVSGEIVWKWPLSVRLKSLGKLPTRKDILTVMKEASANDQSSLVENSDPQKLTIHCSVKGHRQSTPEDIKRCLDTNYPYACDGLIFTPDKAYVFGPDPLMFKWQSEIDIHCNILIRFAKALFERAPYYHSDNSFGISHYDHDNSEVFECRWSSARRSWLPIFARTDKVAPNSDQTIAHVQQISEQPYTMENLVFDLAQINNFKKHGSKSNSSEQFDCDHPAKSHSFDELFSNLIQLVERGEVNRTVDPATGLEIFSYCTPASLSDSIMLRLSRGLVLHPPSKTIVTRPFVRFYEGNFQIYKVNLL